jgi:hypothetical protein
VNGTQVGSTVTNSTNFGSTTGTIRIGGSGFSGSHNINGYLSNFRVVKGTALYTSTFTPPTAALTAVSNTSLLICQSNRFIDNSTNAYTLTRNGNISIQPFSPFAPTAAYSTANVGGSGYFDGTDDALILPSNSALALGSGDFTVEAWVYNQSGANLYPDIVSNSGNIVAFIPNDRSSVYRSILSDDNYPSSGNATLLSASGTIGQNSWAHIAWVRSGSTITVYINGAASGTVTSSTNHTREMQIIGAIAQGASPNFYFWNGYISNLRIVKGTAVYTTNFTPPTTLLTNINNTSLLTNFTNAGIFDQTAKNIIETRGDAKITTSVYKYGTGSIAFDGTGDYLTIPDNQIFNFGTGDFTIEMWIYLNTFADGKAILSKGWSAVNAPFLLYTNGGSNRISFYSSSNGSSWDIADNVAVVNSPSTGQWYHIAVTRSGNTIRTFSNGTLTANVTSSAALYSTTQPITIGGSSGGANYISGYIDDLRITKGYARYTSNFTPPAAAFKDK